MQGGSKGREYWMLTVTAAGSSEQSAALAFSRQDWASAWHCEQFHCKLLRESLVVAWQVDLEACVSVCMGSSSSQTLCDSSRTPTSPRVCAPLAEQRSPCGRACREGLSIATTQIETESDWFKREDKASDCTRSDAHVFCVAAEQNRTELRRASEGKPGSEATLLLAISTYACLPQ